MVPSCIRLAAAVSATPQYSFRIIRRKPDAPKHRTKWERSSLGVGQLAGEFQDPWGMSTSIFGTPAPIKWVTVTYLSESECPHSADDRAPSCTGESGAVRKVPAWEPLLAPSKQLVLRGGGSWHRPFRPFRIIVIAASVRVCL